MTKPGTNGPAPPMEALTTELAVPRPFLSSTAAGWDGLVAQAFHEPRDLEGRMEPASPDLHLVLFAGGALHLERRQAHDSWEGGDIQPGELILNWGARPSQELRWWSLSAIPTQTLHLHLRRELVARVAEQVKGTDLASLQLVGCGAALRDPLLSQIALALWRELEEPAPAGNLYADSAAQLLAVHLLRQYTSGGAVRGASKGPTQPLTSQQMKRVIDCVQAQCAQPLSLEVLAQQTGYSPYHFARLFQCTTGETPHHFVLRQRIERAQRLLAETALPLARIAGESGFANQSAFTRVFRRSVGMTPRAYRQERAR